MSTDTRWGGEGWFFRGRIKKHARFAVLSCNVRIITAAAQTTHFHILKSEHKKKKKRRKIAYTFSTSQVFKNHGNCVIWWAGVRRSPLPAVFSASVRYTYTSVSPPFWIPSKTTTTFSGTRLLRVVHVGLSALWLKCSVISADVKQKGERCQELQPSSQSGAREGDGLESDFSSKLGTLWSSIHVLAPSSHLKRP